MRTSVLIPLILLASMASGAAAQVPWPTTPSWTSLETEYNGTGLDVGDIDGDGWLDLAVSNGNDITASPNFVYLNADGALPPAASWVSDDARYSGHCQLADVDGDGWPELMVANYISAGWGPAQLQIYDNDGGVLATAPSWESPATIHSFRASFGDPDGDGDLDLAVATGEAYHAEYTPNLVFFNEGGVLQPLPGWQSAQSDAAYDAKFVDIDGDGDQDLAFCGGGATGRITIHFNEAGVIDPVAGWTTAAIDNGNTFDFDDLDGDGRVDLLVGFNSQLGGSGRFAVFLTAGGDLPTEPTWTSAFSGYASAVVCADVDASGAADLVTGGWWEPIRVYLNDGAGGFASEPDWQTDATWESVVENIALGDLDNGAVVEHAFAVDAAVGWHELPHRHLQAVVDVTVDDQSLPPDGYAFSLRDGWVSLGVPGDRAVITYRASSRLDLAFSNWDDATYVFEAPEPTSVGPAPVASLGDLRAFPSPFNPQTVLSYRLGAPASVQIRLLDVRGREVDRIDAGWQDAGTHTQPWRPRGLASGVYFYRVEAGAQAATGKVVLAR